MEGVTQLVNGFSPQDPAGEELLVNIYNELRRIAAAKMALEQPGQTLQATALVNEVWLKLSELNQTSWKNRRHFYGAAAEVMRRILVERARSRNSIKRGGGVRAVSLEGIDLPAAIPDDRILLVHEALDQLAAHDPEKAEVVKLRYFVGLKHHEIAALLGVGEKTVKRYWAFSKAWLYDAIKRELGTRPGAEPGTPGTG
ncbi:MAG TPA: RNA polymerase subunit sigma-24 [Verrucomicrobiales bacterium]|nr:RNA polymerase subunit sigma-24 [Verrucomicrobiales bacterium]